MLDSDWQAHLNAPFPAKLRGEEIDGIDLVLLDADTTGCIQTYFGSGNRLDAARLDMLKCCYRDLATVEDALTGDGLHYFERLINMVEEVLARLTEHQP